jgi:SMI1 / KNR4 family (SUKH-1)
MFLEFGQNSLSQTAARPPAAANSIQTPECLYEATMDHVKEYFSQCSDDLPRGNFHHVIALHEAPDIDWENIHSLVPNLCKGWYELANLPEKDRIEFVRGHWMNKLPYRQGVSEFIDRFFDKLQGIGIYITQKIFDDPYEVHLVYALEQDIGFYRGRPPASESDIENLCKQFGNLILPQDYLIFLQIHDGFSKTTDSTGLIPSNKFSESHRKFKEMLMREEMITTLSGHEVDPQTLIPFYESFGMPFFQCFWSEWYPEEEMGNVYYSGETKTILFAGEKVSCEESMAFATFLDWLKFYLEGVS